MRTVRHERGAGVGNEIARKCKSAVSRVGEKQGRASTAAKGKLLHTCELNGANPFDYLVELPRHAQELQEKPSEWMPWNYRDSLAWLATSAAA